MDAVGLLHWLNLQTGLHSHKKSSIMIVKLFRICTSTSDKNLILRHKVDLEHSTCSQILYDSIDVPDFPLWRHHYKSIRVA